MKNTFLALLIIGILLLLSAIYVPPPTHGEQVANLLLSHPDDWHFAFTTPDGRLLGFDADISKKQMLSYLRGVADRYPVSRDLVGLASITVILLSAFGLRRSSRPKGRPTV